MRPRILIVDDDTSFRTRCREWLGSTCEVMESTTPQGALQLLQKRPFDVVLLDVRFDNIANGEEAGLEFLPELQKLPEVPQVFLLTGHDVAADTLRWGSQAARYGVEVLHKSHLTPQELQVRLRTVLERRRAFPEWQEFLQRFGILSCSGRMEEVARRIRAYSMVEEPVLILGETGTGKSLVARALHDASPRAKGPFQDWHVSAVPLELLSRELFGAEAGAYTGAARRTDGAFHAANGGTLFLDEIGELTAEAQVVLLKAIEEKQIRRLGSTTAERVDVRIIAATNRPWEELRGRFREDFFYRITAFTIELPALRERPEDIALLARHLLQQHGCELVPAAEEVLLEYHWPGNVRELQHILKRVQVEATLEGTRTITSRLVRKVLQEHAQVPSSAVESLGDARLRTECQKIWEALRKHGGNVTRAAKELGMRRETLSRKISERKERCRELGYEIDPVLCKGKNSGKSSTNGAQQ